MPPPNPHPTVHTLCVPGTLGLAAAAARLAYPFLRMWTMLAQELSHAYVAVTSPSLVRH